MTMARTCIVVDPMVVDPMVEILLGPTTISTFLAIANPHLNAVVNIFLYNT
jgi:hypothetical protein